MTYSTQTAGRYWVVEKPSLTENCPDLSCKCWLVSKYCSGPERVSGSSVGVCLPGSALVPGYCEQRGGGVFLGDRGGHLHHTVTARPSGHF